MSRPTLETTSGVGGPCPTGYYCPVKTEDPMACPIGTYRDSLQGMSESDCYMCKLGHYCPSTNHSDVEGPCDPGFFCLTGSSTPTPTGM